MKSPKEILKGILETDGVKAVMISGRDGLIISSVGTIDADTETLGAIASSGLGSSEALGAEAGIGELEQFISQYKSGIAIIQLVTSEAVLLLLATKDANLGMLRLAINKAKKPLMDILSY
ncbi:MAG: roadblock/LC7 domain-containing protein [Candidatus Eremiobacterota bacterium]